MARRSSTSSPPTGTVTFLFTDIEASTKRWEQYPQQMGAAVARHDALLRDAVEANTGYVFKTVGDAFCVAFPTAPQALQAALDAQHALLQEDWDQVIGPVKVRMALHTGSAQERESDYFGPPVNRVARLLSAGHGGQILLSMPTQELVRDQLAPGAGLLDMGEHRLKDLIRPEHIFQLVVPGLPSEFPPLKTLDNHPNNLPVQLTSFIGRVKEVGEICTVLARADVHLLTLTGPGGTGKTRLALQVGAELLDDYADGVWFVELAALTDPNLVTSEIARTLGVREVPGQALLETLQSYLHDKQLLLVLDNFEQVVAAAPQLGRLLSASPNLKMLSTSRISLRVKGEKEYPVPALTLPDLVDLLDTRHMPPVGANFVLALSQYEAVRLFIERATDVKPDFEVTNDNAPAVAEICVRLDGLPLAIELAAARVRMLPPQALLSRLSSRLKVLTGGARDLPKRQQTLRAAIEWSYDLLDEGEKQLFRRIAVFVGGRTLEATEAVCNAGGDLEIDVLDGVQSLVDKSLLRQEEGGGGEPRFVMLETIHEYAREKLQESGEAEALEREHALYFMALAEEAETQLKGAKQAEWLHRLEEEHDNIRVALRWAKEQAGHGDAKGAENAEVGLRIAGALWRFWDMRGYFSEGREQLASMLALSTPSTISTMQAPLSPQSQSQHLFRAKALNGAGNLAHSQGDYAAARSLLEESLSIYRELGDKRGIAMSLNNLGNVAYSQGDYATSCSLHEESLSIKRELGDKRGIASSLNNLGNVAHHQGTYAAARSLFEESLAIRRELGDKQGIAACLAGLGGVAAGMGQTHAPTQTQGQAKRGARLLGAAEALLEAISAVLDVGDRTIYEQGIASARAQLSEEEFERAWTEGRAVSMEQATAYALEGIREKHE